MRDFKQKIDGDIDLSSGDIVWGESTRQHQRDIILTHPGELKHALDSGVGVDDFINDDNPDELLRKTRQEFIKDGQKVTKISFNNGTINTEAYYASDYSS